MYNPRCQHFRMAIHLTKRAGHCCNPLQVIDEATGQPSDLVIEANMTDLARYALICQVRGA